MAILKSLQGLDVAESQFSYSKDFSLGRICAAKGASALVYSTVM
jgi:hypothetical protein